MAIRKDYEIFHTLWDYFPHKQTYKITFILCQYPIFYSDPEIVKYFTGAWSLPATHEGG